LRLDTASAVLLRVAAMSSYRLGGGDSALAACRRALEKFPDHAGLRIDLATMEIEMGPGHPGYGKTLKNALDADPGDLDALYLLGRKHSLEGNFGDAENVFRSVLKRDPNHPKALAQLGISLFQQAKMPEASENMIAALRRNPKDYNSWYNLGEWYLITLSREEDPGAAQRLRAKALQSYLHAVELNDEHVQAHYRIGVLLHGNAQYKEAIRHFEAALRNDSTYVSAWFQMGVAYQRLALAEKARACLRRAFELDPLNRVVIAKLRELS
jgi:tetratricopeptide (TPR) repeat protein